MASAEVHAGFPGEKSFEASSLFIATWLDVKHASTKKVRTERCSFSSQATTPARKKMTKRITCILMRRSEEPVLRCYCVSQEFVYNK